MKKLFAAMVIVPAIALSSAAYGDKLMCEGTLSRAQEVVMPVGGGLTEGRVKLDFDAGLTQVRVKLQLQGNSSDATRAHFHCGLPGVNGPIAFGMVDPGPCDPVELARGNLDCVLTNADFAGADCTGPVGRPVNNIAALFFAAREGFIYANVHTVQNRGGEVRGQLLCKD